MIPNATVPKLFTFIALIGIVGVIYWVFRPQSRWAKSLWGFIFGIAVGFVGSSTILWVLILCFLKFAKGTQGAKDFGIQLLMHWMGPAFIFLASLGGGIIGAIYSNRKDRR